MGEGARVPTAMPEFRFLYVGRGMGVGVDAGVGRAWLRATIVARALAIEAASGVRVGGMGVSVGNGVPSINPITGGKGVGVGELAQATDANRTKAAKRNLGMWGTPFAAKIGAVAKTATILKYHQRGRVTRPSDFLRRGYGTSGMESGCLSIAIVSQFLLGCQ